MTIEIAIVIGGIIGLALGLYASRKGIKERDERIKKLEDELKVQRNVVKALNEDNVKLRKKNKNVQAKTD